MHTQGWLYHITEEARIFDGDAYAKAKMDGWVDSPALLAGVAVAEAPSPDFELLPEPPIRRGPGRPRKAVS